MGALDPQQELELLWMVGIQEGLWANTWDRKDLPQLQVRQSREKTFTSGTAWNSHRIVITRGVDASLGDFLGVLAHEVTHLLLPWKVNHEPEFWGTLISLIEKRWRVTIDISRERNVADRQRRINADLDAFFTDAANSADGRLFATPMWFFTSLPKSG